MSSNVTRWTGSTPAFGFACGVIVVWAILGPVFHFSDTWQLVINTGTTVLTFLMVFIIQNTMNRESAALHLKLDELIKVTAEAHDDVRGAEKLTEDEISQLARKV